jgi:hypothetical protein
MPDTTPRRGRPPAGGKGRPLRVDADTWAALEEIARRENLTHGGLPSPSKAVAWLVARAGGSQVSCYNGDGR